MHNVVDEPDIVGDVEPHLLDIWYAKDVGNDLLVDPKFYGTEPSILVGVRGSWIEVSKIQMLHYLKYETSS